MPLVDINKATKVDLVRLRGIGNSIAGAIIMARPFKSRVGVLKISGISERLLQDLTRQGLKIEDTAKEEVKRRQKIFKHKAWAPRPVTKLIKGERPQLMVYEPKTGVLSGFDLKDERIPLIHLSTDDDSALFEIENNEPRFEMKTKSGTFYMDATGITIREGGGTEKYSWKEKSKISKKITQLALKDEVFRSIGVKLGRGLRNSVSATRGAESSFAGHTFSGFIPDSLVDLTTAGFTSLQLIEVFPGCALSNYGESIVEGALSLGRTLGECAEDVIEDVIEDCVDPIPDCLDKAADDLRRCKRRCNRKYDSWRNKWKRPFCKAACYVEYARDVAVCLGKALICTVITPAETVEDCINEIGQVVSTETATETSKECDIRLYAKDDAIGSVIDSATCSYGYSHAALVCGNLMTHAVGKGVITSQLDYYGDRKYATVRLGLTDAQCRQLCICVQGKIDSDYDYLEAGTFGTVDDPGKEVCTMLIMNCLDEIGFDREAIGLGDFVSPNDLARQLGAPRASNL